MQENWQDLQSRLLSRPVQRELCSSLCKGKAFPIGGDFSATSGLNVPAFFRACDSSERFVPILGYGPHNEDALRLADSRNLPIALCEDSFLRAATVFGDCHATAVFRQSVSLTCDTRGFYFDATRPTDLEDMIQNAHVSASEIEEARALVSNIVSARLSKYNNQPLDDFPLPGGASREKILVIDQDYGDTATTLGCAADSQFADMLTAAADENPNADIIVKTHPDALVENGRKGYFSSLGERKSARIFKLTTPLNPYAAMSQVARVYVATSAFGFEALLAGKPVSVFGKPWYSGWGVTDDRQRNKRRSRKRTVEELFHLFYCRYSRYADPDRNAPIGIDKAISVLLRLRAELKI